MATIWRTTLRNKGLLVVFLMAGFVLLLFIAQFLPLDTYSLVFRNTGVLRNKYYTDGHHTVEWTHTIPDSRDKIHIVVMFYKMLDDKWILDYFPTVALDISRRQQRLAEIGECLEKNLNHSMVATVHMLYPNITVLKEYLSGLKLLRLDKLFIHEQEATTVADFLHFASDNLQGRTVMIINADVYLEDGFERLDIAYMRAHHVVYALTRHSIDDCTSNGYCQNGYSGGHDCYMFYLQQQLPDGFYDEVNFEPSHLGIENRVIWAFTYVLNYTVINPCYILRIMHNHCSKLRPNYTLRKGLELNHSKLAFPSKTLYKTVN